MKDLINDPDVKVQSKIAFEDHPSLKVLVRLFFAICEESKDYCLWRVSTTSASSEPTFTFLGE